MQLQPHYTSRPPSSNHPLSSQFPRFRFPSRQNLPSPSPAFRVRVSLNRGRPNPNPNPREHALGGKKKDNVWSVDNDLSATESSAEEKRKKRERVSFRRKRRGKANGRRKEKKGHGHVLVSAAMMMEIETVLQTQEPVIKPVWDTFASSVSGIWRGVGAVFSPFTAEMEPLGVGSQSENLYDCYTLSYVKRETSKGLCHPIHRKTNWVALNPLGENHQHFEEGFREHDKDREAEKGISDVNNKYLDLPSYESFDFGKSDLLEEDSMSMEPGLVFFEDGSYSRGPAEIPVAELDESKYFISPTFRFEQCLVKGCHKRLRIVHTIEFNEGGSNLQIIRVAVYEEQWVSPVNVYVENDSQFDLKPISQRKRTQPSDLAGSWKVFEVSATPIFNEETVVEESGRPPYVYLCTETLKKRSLPENATYFREEEIVDMKDTTVLWLPGGITGYVDVDKDGILCIGVGWYLEEGINLVMERDYGTDGKLKEVRSKTEVKRKWTDPSSP